MKGTNVAYRYKGVLFDLDGTLLDTQELILASFHHAVQEVLGRDYPDAVLMQKVGQPLTVQMWDFTDDEAVHDELLRVYRAHNETVHDQVVSAFPGVGAALAALDEAGVPMGVVTSKRHRLAAHALDILGLAPHLAFVIGSDDCATHKPDPGPVLLGCERLGLDPSTCLYVGDSPYDLQAGRGAGCDTAAALWGMFPADVLRAEQPTWELGKIEELLSLA